MPIISGPIGREKVHFEAPADHDPKMLQQAILNGAEVNIRFENGGITP